MDQEAKFGTSTRRFIFTDEFYDNLESMNKPEEETTRENIITIPTPTVDTNESNGGTINNNYQPDPYEALVTPQPILEINRNSIPASNDSITPSNIINNSNLINSNISTEVSGEIPKEENVSNNINNFFSNQVVETTTVYDSVGNTISQTKYDSTNPDEIIEEIKPPVEVKKQEEKASIDDGRPNLGIPTREEMPELREVNPSKIEDEIPSIVGSNSNDINLNVETGIDTSLEQQLINDKDIYIPPMVDEYAGYLVKNEPVEKYRAVRRKIDPIVYDDEEEVEPLEESIESLVETKEDNWEPDISPTPTVITEEINYDEPIKEEKVTKSDLLPKLIEKEKETGKISILARYGDDFCSHDYVTNPAIGRDREIKELDLILLTPEKSAILVGKPGIGKTSIVEGLAYQIQRDNVPDALKGYTIISVKTTSLLGSLTNGETRLQTLIDELKDLDKIILFIDEVHMLMGATNESSLDFANMFKESLGRGSIKMIGATTSEEYERYVLRDKAFVRRFQRVDVLEPNREETIEILMGTLPKIEKTTGAKLKYTHFIKTEIMAFIVDITTEYKRVYGIGSRYPDICITLLNQAFSEAVFDNRSEVNIFDIRSAIEHSKNIYPDVIRKELVNFDQKFKATIEDEENNH